jgi:hypothetical protein
MYIRTHAHTHRILMENLSEHQCSVHEEGFGASRALRYTHVGCGYVKLTTI